MKTIHFFLDFDGTIASCDVVDLILEKFADPSWKKIEEEWAAGKIGSRECLTRQLALVKASEEDIAKALSTVSLDEHFVEFLRKAEVLGVQVSIVSDGFDLFIEKVLKNNTEIKTGAVKAHPIFSNKLKKTAQGFEPIFTKSTECIHGCANCKPAVMKKLSSPGDEIFFVGDGLSDRYAAQHAHMVFAKDKLLTYCLEKKIDHIAFKDFKKITDWLSENHAILKKASFGTRPPLQGQ